MENVNFTIFLEGFVVSFVEFQSASYRRPAPEDLVFPAHLRCTGLL